jgi:hypothetical protein
LLRQRALTEWLDSLLFRPFYGPVWVCWERPVSQWTPGELVARLDDMDVLAEIERRIQSNTATSLAVRYLLSTSEEDKADAFDGLVALCWKAKGNLFIGRTPSELAQGMTAHECTREFIVNFVLEYLKAHVGKPQPAIYAAALTDKFQYIGAACRNGMIDAIRKRTAPKNAEPQQWSLDDIVADVVAADDGGNEPITHGDSYFSTAPGLGCSLNTADTTYHKVTTAQPNFTTGPRHDSADLYLTFIEFHKPKLTAALGESGYEVLLAYFDVYPHGLTGTNQAAKSAVTQAIARRRKVSERQAQKDKRQFHDRVADAMSKGNPDVSELYRLIGYGEDDDTLTTEVITDEGRKRSIRFSIPLRFSSGNTNKVSARKSCTTATVN